MSLFICATYHTISYAADGVHPSALGSRIAAETIVAVIRQHKEE